jgi:uncharacterized membrane protein (UPF0127 family)
MSSARGAGQAVLLALLALAAPALGQEVQAGLDQLPRERIVLETRERGRHNYRAWRAETQEARARGLMYVSELADDQAMIFVYDEPQVVSMWMKNTYLPLDMLFVDARGCIVSIAEHTRPLSTASIGSGSPVTLVVEIRGGGAAARSAKVGDRVWRPDAGWPADASGGC